MSSKHFWVLNFFLFMAIALVINVIVTKVAIKNKTWEPYVAPDMIAQFSYAMSLVIMAIWLLLFFSFVGGDYIQ